MFRKGEEIEFKYAKFPAKPDGTAMIWSVAEYGERHSSDWSS